MEKKIIEFIANEFHGGQVDMDFDSETDLLDGGLVDSMGMMRLIQYVEETFELKVAPQEMTIDNFVSVEAMVAYIEKKQN